MPFLDSHLLKVCHYTECRSLLGVAKNEQKKFLDSIASLESLTSFLL